MRGVQGMLRNMMCALEARWRKGITDEHKGLAGWRTTLLLLGHCEVSKDGRTAYDRSEGNQAMLGGVEFGKLSSVWEDGVFLGAQ